MIKPRENTFEPGKQVEYDPQYTGDQMNYIHQTQEQELQDKLFQIYEELAEDPADEGYGYEEVEEVKVEADHQGALPNEEREKVQTMN